MTLTTALALFVAMMLLAALPSISTLAVVSRAIASGTVYGLFTALGIVMGDIFFILFTIYGLSAIATTFGELFFLFKILGGVYLIWLGICLFQSRAQSNSQSDLKKTSSEKPTSSKCSSVLTGLLITLGDQKAILFYMGFLPTFIDLTNPSLTDISVIILIATISILSVKSCYAYAAGKTQQFFQSAKATKVINTVSSSIMILIGVYSILKP